MQINISELMRAKGRLEDVETEIKNNLSAVSIRINLVNDNIKSSELATSNANLLDKIESLKTELETNLNLLIEFMGKQLDSYTVTNAEAKASLESLVSMITGTYAADGSIIAADTKTETLTNVTGSALTSSASTIDTSIYTSNASKGFVVSTGNTTYDLSSSDTDLLYSIVAAESDKSYDDALAVISVILNRCENSAWVNSYGTSPVKQATAKNQFVVYQSGSYKTYTNGNAPDTVKQAVNDALAGVRNCNYLSFRSNGSKNYSNNQITSTGNRYL
jgi:hypothetical protein